MKTPILETKRLVLRTMKSADSKEVFLNWTSDPEVAKYMRWNTHENERVTKEWLKTEEELEDSDEVYNWGIVLRETGQLIGSVGLVWIEEKKMYELGYNVMRKYWNQGIATEAAERAVLFALNNLGQTQLYCCHAVDNPASGRVMKKVGFHYCTDGIYYSWDKKKKFKAKEYLLVNAGHF